MALRYLDAASVRTALPMPAAIDAVAAIMVAYRDGNASAPTRSIQSIRRDGREDCAFLVMPGAWPKRGAAAAKVISNVPDNPAAGRPTVQGVAVLLDAETGSPRLIADAPTLTSLRTGAVVGLATRFLARQRCDVVGMVGTGVVAADLVSGVAAVRGVETLLVTDSRQDVAARFAERSPLPAEALDDADDVAAAADVLITATSSLQPVVSAAAIRPGTHINAVGNFSPTGREIDGPTVAAAMRYVDHLDNAMEEAGELLLAASEGRIPAGVDGIVGDLAGLVGGTVPGRTDDEQITLFKTVGTALSDVAALVAAAETAEREGLGVLL